MKGVFIVTKYWRSWRNLLLQRTHNRTFAAFSAVDFTNNLSPDVLKRGSPPLSNCAFSFCKEYSHSYSAYINGGTTSELAKRRYYSTVLSNGGGIKVNDPRSRTSSLWHIHRDISFLGFGSPEHSAWSKAVSEAEKLVGYPTSFMSLRCLLSDELSNVALQVRKLVGTNHPLLKTARTFIYDGRNTMQTRGLIVLLVSKAAGPTTPTNQLQQNIVSGIYASQRALAEITEMIHTAYLVHRGVVDLKKLLPTDGPLKSMEFGNKMAVLSGDFLLASACTGLAQLKNTKVVEIVSTAISDMMEAEFTASTTHQINMLSAEVALSDWMEKHFLSSGSLIAKSCQAALELASHSVEMQELAFDYGKNMALAQQLHSELSPFKKPLSANCQINLNSAPVIIYLEMMKNKNTLHKYNKNGQVDFRMLHKDITSSESLEKTKALCHEYGQKALQAIDSFPVTDARNALQNIIRAVAVR